MTILMPACIIGLQHSPQIQHLSIPSTCIHSLTGYNRQLTAICISSYLSVCEVVLAEFLPQQPVFAEHLQVGSHLTKAHQVPPITQSLHDVQL